MLLGIVKLLEFSLHKRLTEIGQRHIIESFFEFPQSGTLGARQP